MPVGLCERPRRVRERTSSVPDHNPDLAEHVLSVFGSDGGAELAIKLR